MFQSAPSDYPAFPAVRASPTPLPPPPPPPASSSVTRLRPSPASLGESPMPPPSSMRHTCWWNDSESGLHGWARFPTAVAFPITVLPQNNAIGRDEDQVRASKTNSDVGDKICKVCLPGPCINLERYVDEICKDKVILEKIGRAWLIAQAGENCGICMEQGGGDVLAGCCGKSVHSSCWAKCLLDGGRCPWCRKSHRAAPGLDDGDFSPVDDAEDNQGPSRTSRSRSSSRRSRSRSNGRTYRHTDGRTYPLTAYIRSQCAICAQPDGWELRPGPLDAVYYCHNCMRRTLRRWTSVRYVSSAFAPDWVAMLA